MPASSFFITLNTHLSQIDPQHVQSVIAGPFMRSLSSIFPFRERRSGRMVERTPANLRAVIEALGVERTRGGLVHAHWTMTIQWDDYDLLLTMRKGNVSLNRRMQRFFDAYYPGSYVRASLTRSARYRNYVERAQKEGRRVTLQPVSLQIRR